MVRELNKKSGFAPEMHQYMLDHNAHHPALAGIRRETLPLVDARYLATPEQGNLLRVMARATRARIGVEVGTYTGYSTVALADGMGEGGRLITLDIDHEPYETVGRKYAREAGVEDRIELREGPAVDTMAQLLHELGPDSLDLAFVDGNKEDYRSYVKMSALLLRQGGLLIVDNTSGLGGRVADRDDRDPKIEGIRAANDYIFSQTQEGVFDSAAILPISDGMTLAYKL